jgi:hypothetical protein
MKSILTSSITIVLYSLLSLPASLAKEKMLNQEQLAPILVDIALAKAIIHRQADWPVPQKELFLQQQAELIYQSYGVDGTTFQKSYKLFLKDPRRLSSLYDTVIAALEQLLKESEQVQEVH